jgi:malate-CoA ligase subunit beta
LRAGRRPAQYACDRVEEAAVDIHEYQAKELLAQFGVPVPRGGLAYSPEQAAYRARDIGGEAWVVKAQIHSGGRGKAGGVRLCKDDREIEAAADELLGRMLVTEQTGARGKLVSRLYVEPAVTWRRELYLGFVLDRKTERVMVVASSAGGMEIEEIAHEQPETLIRIAVEPAVGMQAFQARELAFALGLEAGQIAPAVATILGCYRAFRELDATMVEINPLIVTEEGKMLCLDAKMSFDDNALFRRPQIAELRDKSQEDPRETQAADRGLSYVGLEGDIGCIVNGAGLAMATMDMIKLAGGEPANFLDIGGGATPERVARAFKLVTMDRNVKAVLVNIFAGINRCDWVAQGVVKAVEIEPLSVPLIVRLAGTHVEEGRAILAASGVDVITATSLADAAQKSVAAARIAA